MIIQCNKQQISDIENYIGNEYYKCLYLYLDLKQFGADSEYVTSWIQSHEGKITSVCLKYHTALHLYSKDNVFDVEELVNHINEVTPTIICASADTIKILSPYTTSKGFIPEYGHIGRFTSFEPSDPNVQIIKATLADVTEIAKLLYEDEDIGASYSFDDLVAQMKERLTQGFVRSYIIKDGNKVIAHFGTGAEVGKVCTINYVITKNAYRGKGLSTNLFRYACKQLKEEGKEIYSVYYPENSRRLHHKMGFEDCCECGKLFINIK